MTSPNSTNSAAAPIAAPAPATAPRSRLADLIRRKAVVLPLLILPGLWPIWTLALHPNPTATTDPGKYLLHHLGFTAVVVLVIALSFSPLRTLGPKSDVVRALQRHRRLVGVTAFLYAALHVTMHFIYEGGFGTFATDWKKPFIAFGLGTLVILTLLAATSFDRIIRWLGARRWKLLHRLVYLAAILAACHQVLGRKLFPIQVVWIFAPLVVLQLGRFLYPRFAPPRR